MAKDPAFLFYYQDFFTGISDLSNEEAGAYIRCLCMQASKGGLTEKHMKIICISNDVHNTIKTKFIFDENDGLYKNERLVLEIKKRKEYSESRSKNRKGATKNSKKTIDNISKTYVQHMENENENENVVKKKNRGSGGKEKTLAVQPKPNTLTDNLNLLQTVEMHNGLPPGSAATLAKVFYEIQSSTGNLEGKTIKDYQMHFSNWARKQAQAIKANTTSKAETVQDTFKRWEAQLSQNPEAFYQQALSSYHE
jgi:uncharacterized protein YdaU (DUF1376 family)